MKVTRRSRLLLRLQALIFAILFTGIIGMLAWLSTQYVYQADWTTGTRNSVSADTRRLLDGMEHPVSISAFVHDDELLRSQIRGLIASYQRVKDDITLEFINPDKEPARARELGITGGGAIIIRYLDRSETIQTLNEQQLTNALLRLTRQSERWIVFLTGHGERRTVGTTNHGLGIFTRELERKGLNTHTVNLAESDIPANTSLVVIASPRVDLLPGETEKLLRYIEQGGNLLWLAEPGGLHGLEPLAARLGFSLLPGVVVVDINSRMLDTEDPTFVAITGYPRHEVTHAMSAVTIYPEVAALEINDSDTWNAVPLLTTQAHFWTELGKDREKPRFDRDSDERAGPLDIGVIFTRPRTDESGENLPMQRVIVIGDGDFLSNTYLGNAGNLGLGLSMVQWLSHDDAALNIQIESAPDTRLELGKVAQALIVFGFLMGLPVLLLLTGIAVWLLRRRR